MSTVLQQLGTIFSMAGSATTQSWSEKCTDNSWSTDDVTFPEWPDIDPNATHECKIRFVGYGIRTVLRYLECIENNTTTGTIQTCVDDAFENFFLPAVSGCIVSE